MAPDGSTDAYTWADNTKIFSPVSVAAIEDATYTTYSIHVSTQAGAYVTFEVGNNPKYSAVFSRETGEITQHSGRQFGSAKINDDWIRIWVTYPPHSYPADRSYHGIVMTDADGNLLTGSNSIDIWGAEVTYGEYDIDRDLGAVSLFSNGTDTISGGAGNDTLIAGGNSFGSFIGGQGDDVFKGDAVDLSQFVIEDFENGDSIVITDGDYSSLNGDLIDGEINFGGGNVLDINGVAGLITATYDSGDGSTTITIAPPQAYSDGNDTIVGTANDDILFAGGGDDTVSGGDGNDTLSGSDGDDLLYGGNGDDILAGGGGNDSVYGLAGDDVLSGGNEDDLLVGGSGADLLIGGAGADTLSGGAGTDVASYAGSSAGVIANLATGSASGGDAAGDTLTGIEALIGSDHADTLTGSSVANTLLGGAGDDVLSGGAGNDTVQGGLGADTLYGGAGTGDLADYSNASSAVHVDLKHTSSSPGSLGEAVGDRFYGIEGVIGSAFNDSLEGGGGADILIGGDGNDTIHGYPGSDTLSGGNGDDSIRGGEQDDLIFGGDGNDVLEGRGSEDTLYGGAGSDTLYGHDANGGGTSADALFGGSGTDVVYAGAGSDSLYGGAGDDSLYGEGGDDVIYFLQGDGDDLVFGFTAGSDRVAVGTALGFTTATDVYDAIAEDTITGDAYLQIGNDKLTLVGISKASLDANDFLLV